MEFALIPGRMMGTLWPEGSGGTEVMLNCLDAVGGLLVAVVSAAPVDRVGWHPYGNPDRSALTAMGIVELVLHTYDILSAHGIDYRGLVNPVSSGLGRIFPRATRSNDPWQDLLTATGRTSETRVIRWRWDSSSKPADTLGP